MPAITYNITITMTAATVEALLASNYWLYAFRGVESADFAALPLVCLQTHSYSTTTPVSWSSDTSAYTSHSPIGAGRQVAIGFAEPIAIGQLLRVESPAGTGVVTGDGIAGALAILNTTDAPLTCGICDSNGKVPICAMPLYGNGLQIAVTVPKALLLFATISAPPGTAVAVSYGPGVLIDLGTGTDAAVTFDINKGWSSDGDEHITVVPANSNIVDLLVGRSAVVAGFAHGWLSGTN